MLIDKAGIARLIPHAGAMCLLDGVLDWGEAHIRCTTGTHRDIGNPLRREDRLGILCGVEYAAQAMALHGSLSSCGGKDFPSAPVGAGYLASLRGLVCHIDRLDLLHGALIVEAERLHRDAAGAIYGFTLRHDDVVLLEGRAAVVLKAVAP